MRLAGGFENVILGIWSASRPLLIVLGGVICAASLMLASSGRTGPTA
jgi:hypothetical protein